MERLPERIVARANELAACCEHLANCPEIGLDTEFVGEDTYHPQLCLVQVATPECLYLIDPLTAGPLDAFWKLVIDPARRIIVHAGREEIRLCNLWIGQPPTNLFDLQIGAGLIGLGYPLGHGPLIHQMLGISLSKGETLTDWRKRPLTKQQIAYAFDDVRYLLPIAGRMDARLRNLGRTDWVAEETAALIQHAILDNATGERWRRLRSLGGLDRRRLAIARALYNWREERATATNRPARVILRDDLIVEIARRNPSRERDLNVLRGRPRHELEELLEIVEQARKLPDEACPEPVERDSDPAQMGLLVNILQAVLSDLCLRHHLSPTLVASNQDVKLLIRSSIYPDTTEVSPLAQGWRATFVMPELLAILEGRRAIKIENARHASPLGYVSLTPPP